MNGYHWTDVHTLTSVWMSAALLALLKTLPLLLTALIATKLFQRFLSTRLQTLLWMLVVVRLLLPYSLEAPWNLGLKLPSWNAFTSPSNQTWTMATHPFDPALGAPSHRWTPTLAAEPQNTWSTANWSELWSILGGFALLGTTLYAAWSIANYLRFAAHLRTMCHVDAPRVSQILEHECRSMGMQRIPEIREFPNIDSPAIFGLFQPTLCWPASLEQSLTDQDLRWILRHELAHIQRRDCLTLTIASCAQAFHWFHPVGSFVANQLRATMEIAADRIALGKSSNTDAKRYAELLLQISQGRQNNAWSIGLLSFSQSKSLKKRLRTLMEHSHGQPLRRSKLLAISLIAIALLGIIDYQTAQSQSKDTSNLPQFQSIPVMQVEAQPSEHPRMILCLYPVEDILEQNEGEFAEAWKDVGGLEQLLQLLYPNRQIKLHEAKILANLTQTEHQSLSAMIGTWRLYGPKQIAVEVKFMTTDAAMATGFTWKTPDADHSNPTGSMAPLITLAKANEIQQLVQRLQADPRSNILQAPKVTGWLGQATTISDQQQTPIITSYRTTSDGKLEPMVEMIASGTKTTLCPSMDDAGDVELRFEVEAAHLRSLATVSLPIETGDPKQPNATVQVPDLWRFSLASTLKVASGDSILVAVPFSGTKQKTEKVNREILIVSITPRVLDL